MSGMTRSTPNSSDSGNIIPESTTMMSSPNCSTIMFMPNSPSPPRGIAVSECVVLLGALLKETLTPQCKRESYHTAKIREWRRCREQGSKRIPKRLMVRITGKEVGDRNEDNSAECCGGNRVQKTSAKKFKLHKDPPANKRSNKTKNNVRDAAKAASASDLPREPAGDQAHQKPPDKPVRFDPDTKNSLCENVRGKHEASSGKKDCI